LKLTLESQKQELIKKNQLLLTQRDELERYRKQKLPTLLQKTLRPWVQSWNPKPEPITYNDPVLGTVHGQIEFDKDLAPLIMHPIVQRLNYVRQLSFSFFEFPTASHSRLTHLFGSAYNAESALRKVLKRNIIFPSLDAIVISDEEKERLITLGKVAAILHDIGHGPFGHALDKYLSLNKPFLQRAEYVELQDKPDKFLSLEYVRKYLAPTIDEVGREFGFDADLVSRLLDSRKKAIDGKDHLVAFHRFIADLIDSALDVDRMDYLARDAYFTGMSSGTINTSRLLSSLVPFQLGDQYTAVFDSSGITFIEQLLYARFSMYVNCYERPKKLAAEAMLSQAVDDFLSGVGKDSGITISEIMLLTDEELIDTILLLSDESMMCYNLVTDLAKGKIYDEIETNVRLPPLTQDAEADEGRASAVPDLAEMDPTLLHFYEGLLSDGIERATIYSNTIDEWATSLRTAGSLQEPHMLLVVAPAFEAFDPRDKAIILLSEDRNSTTSLGEQYPRLKRALTDWTAERLRVRIFVSREVGETQRQKIRAKAKEIFSPRKKRK